MDEEEEDEPHYTRSEWTPRTFFKCLKKFFQLCFSPRRTLTVKFSLSFGYVVEVFFLFISGARFVLHIDIHVFFSAVAGGLLWWQ